MRMRAAGLLFGSVAGLAVVIGLGAGMIVGCDDDGGGGNDMGVDLSIDQSVPTDLAGAGPGTAEVFLSALRGTAYVPTGDGGANAVPNLTTLAAVVRTPETNIASQYVDSSFSTTPGQIHGCVANRYTFGGGPLPTPSVNAGTVSFTGLNSADSIAFIDGDATPVTPISTGLKCTHDPATGQYGCTFSGDATDGATSRLEGELIGNVSFPTLPFATWSAFDKPNSYLVGGEARQQPIRTGSTLSASLAGGGSFGAVQSGGVVVPDEPALVAISRDGTAVPVVRLDGLNVNVTKKLDITWACVANSSTPGDGCGGAGALDLIVVDIGISTNSKERFDAAGASGMGWVRCMEQVSRADATVSVPREAIERALGGQTAGSSMITVVRMQGQGGFTNDHTVFFAAGRGLFGLADVSN